MSFVVDQDKIDQFQAMQSKREVADVLEIDYFRLFYRVHKIPDAKKYTRFEIPKKGGTFREIFAPDKRLKQVQTRLNQILQERYKPKKAVHGFVKKKGNRKRNIVTNAKRHAGQRYVFNLDLKDFFPTIHFGRIRGIFKAYPFDFNLEIATFLAQICCYKKHLPQGAPTSPILSNFVCAKMDYQLSQLARINGCYYTRYADDITFSTSQNDFPSDIAICEGRDSISNVDVGPELERIINGNGFEINYAKVGLQYNFQRQVVTGLTVNKFPNVNRKFLRQLRAMLHACKKFGPDEAGREHYEKYSSRRHRNPNIENPPFEQIIKGKIEFVKMVRGEGNKIYKALLTKFNKCKNQYNFPRRFSKDTDVPLIVTEGKSDWKHLKAALAALQSNGQFQDLDIEFHDYEYTMGNKKLLKYCQNASKINRKRKVILVFDRDISTVNNRVAAKNQNYKGWGKNVFSLLIPVPNHRIKTPNISIEFYYSDAEITCKDTNGQRLYLSSEFKDKSGQHKTTPNIVCQSNKKHSRILCVIDEKVIETNNNKERDISLSKDKFATNILKGVGNFNNFDFSAFSSIFQVIETIIAIRT